MAKANFPNKIWNGLNAVDRKTPYIRQKPSIEDYDQIVAELQATQVQLLNVMQHANISPVAVPTIEEIQAGILEKTDTRYAPINSPAMLNPLPREPNTFIFIDGNGKGSSVSLEQMRDWILSIVPEPKPQNVNINDIIEITDTRYPKFADVPKSFTLNEIVKVTDERYAYKQDIKPSLSLNEVINTTNQLYLPINTKIEVQSTPIGMFADYPGQLPPTGWLLRDGRALERLKYPKLFQVIGTLYGTNTLADFKLPADVKPGQKWIPIIKSD